MKHRNMPDRAIIGVCLILIAAITTAMLAAAVATPEILSAEPASVRASYSVSLFAR